MKSTGITNNRQDETKKELKKMKSDELFIYIRQNIEQALKQSENKRTGTKG